MLFKIVLLKSQKHHIITFSWDKKNICKETEFEIHMRILEQLELVILKSKSCLCSLIDSFTDEGKLSLSSLLLDTSVSFCAFQQCSYSAGRKTGQHSVRETKFCTPSPYGSAVDAYTINVAWGSKSMMLFPINISHS